MTPLPPNADLQPSDAALTTFQQAVADVVLALEPGEVVTYGDVAMEIGRPGSAQAVANVLRRVPALPWWRVIPTSGRLYRTHAPIQRPLLEAEGVRMTEDHRVMAMSRLDVE